MEEQDDGTSETREEESGNYIPAPSSSPHSSVELIEIDDDDEESPIPKEQMSEVWGEKNVTESDREQNSENSDEENFSMTPEENYPNTQFDKKSITSDPVQSHLQDHQDQAFQSSIQGYGTRRSIKQENIFNPPSHSKQSDSLRKIEEHNFMLNQLLPFFKREREVHPTALTCRIRLFKYLRILHPNEQLENLEIIRFPSHNKTLPIFALFVEIVSRGGYSKVSQARKWTEVAGLLNCQFSNNSGMVLKGKYEDIRLTIIENDINLIEEVKNFGSQEAGARQAGLPSRAMTPVESSVFPQFATPVLRERYLAARDHILQKWCLICDRTIDFEIDIMTPLRETFAEADLKVYPLKQAFFVMETLGYMNWGCLNNIPQRSQESFVGGDGPKTILVIGAGLAGLVCALQALKFGHKVVLIEGRNRVGGRVHTDCKTFSAPVDLGAMLITGVQGHPASILTHQLRQKKYSVGESCPIYSLGELLDPEMDAKIETRFNSMLTAAAEASKTNQNLLQEQTLIAQNRRDTRKRGRVRQHRQPEGNSIPDIMNDSLEPTSKYSGVFWNHETGRWGICLTKKASGAIEKIKKEFDSELEAARAHDFELLGKPSHLYSDFKNQALFPLDLDVYSEICPIQTNPKVNTSQLESSEKSKAIGAEFVIQAQREIDRLKRPRRTITSPKRNPSFHDDHSLLERILEEDNSILKYQTEDSRRLEDAYLCWHIANLEYACAASLARVSAVNWDQDDEFDWEGSHVMLPNGFAVLTEGMKNCFLQQGGEIIFGQKIQMIKVRDHKTYLISETGNEFQGDAVVCTVSLGVLKENRLLFDPVLPSWKIGAITRLGFGNLNKVVFEFDEVFWNENHDIFGRVVHPHVGSRGECYMYWALNKLNPYPIILALVAGDAAEEQEFRTDQLVFQRALAALRETFPDKTIPEPKRYVVTRWRNDEFSRGTYSYIAVGSSGDDYSLMAEQIQNGTIYFAGEATCREHPATTGGALVSGLREASKIAAKFGRFTSFHPQNTSELCDLLKNIGNALSLRPGLLPPEKQNITENILSRVSSGKIWTSRDAESLYVKNLETENWFHTTFPSDFLTTSCERHLRATEILPRLPITWDDRRKNAYLAERLGILEWKEGQEIGFWI